MTDLETRAHEYANKILEELRAATTPEECAAISERHAKAFARLQEVAPVRATHIVSLATLKKREFAGEFKTLSAASPRRSVAAHQDKQRTLFD